MPRVHQMVFAFSMVALSWHGMLAVHEFGHVAGAWLTGSQVQRVVLHPLAISRTDVFPNPHPAIVVWCGPVVGCLLPIGTWWCWKHRNGALPRLLQFFAGFCSIANGAYLAIGVFDQVGDCREMLKTGTPAWVLIAFGVVTIPTGLLLWHKLGSPRHFLANADQVPKRMAWITLTILAAYWLIAFTRSPAQ